MKDIKFFSVIILAVLCLGAANGQMMPATQRASLTANDTDKHVVSIVMNVYCDALWQLLRKTRAPKRVKIPPLKKLFLKKNIIFLFFIKKLLLILQFQIEDDFCNQKRGGGLNK